jgi:hypothetical protein
MKLTKIECSIIHCIDSRQVNIPFRNAPQGYFVDQNWAVKLKQKLMAQEIRKFSAGIITSNRQNLWPTSMETAKSKESVAY